MTYPRFRWHPETGERRLCKTSADDDSTFLDFHPSDPMASVKAKISELHALQNEAMTKANAEVANKTKATEAAFDLTDAEVVAALKSGNIQFDPASAPVALRNLLVGTLRNALTQRGKAPAPTDNAKQLLAAVQQG